MSDKYSERIVRAREYLSDLLGERNFRNDDAVDLANYDEWLDERRSKDVCECGKGKIFEYWNYCGSCGRPIKEITGEPSFEVKEVKDA